MESTAALVSQIVVADAGLPRTERGAAEPASLRMRRIDRDLYLYRRLRRRPRRGHDVEKITARTGQIDAGRGELAATRGGLAHQFEQLFPGFGPHDGFVGGAPRREPSGQPLLLFLGFRLFVGAIEVFEREGDILRRA